VAGSAIDLAIDELAKDRSAMGLAHANRDVYKLLKDGVKVSFQNEEGEEVDETIRVIDWNEPENNDFFLASQFWVSGDIYKRRADLVDFAATPTSTPWTCLACAVSKEEGGCKSPFSTSVQLFDCRFHDMRLALRVPQSAPGDGLRSTVACQRTLLCLRANRGKIAATAAIFADFTRCTVVRFTFQLPILPARRSGFQLPFTLLAFFASAYSVLCCLENALKIR
jgi:hypothetical protein